MGGFSVADGAGVIVPAVGVGVTDAALNGPMVAVRMAVGCGTMTWGIGWGCSFEAGSGGSTIGVEVAVPHPLNSDMTRVSVIPHLNN